MLVVNNKREWELQRSEGIEEGENDCNGTLIFTNRKYILDYYNPDTNNLFLRKRQPLTQNHKINVINFTNFNLVKFYFYYL